MIGSQKSRQYHHFDHLSPIFSGTVSMKQLKIPKMTWSEKSHLNKKNMPPGPTSFHRLQSTPTPLATPGAIAVWRQQLPNV